MTYIKHSLDFKNLAVKKYIESKSLRKTATYFEVAKSTLHNWVKAHPMTKCRRRYKPSKLCNQVLSIIENELIANPFCTAKYLSNVVHQRLSIPMSDTYIRIGIKKCQFSRKQPTCVVQRPGLHEERKLFANRMVEHHTMKDLISIDETSFFFQMFPTKGYSKKGTRLTVAKHTHQRHRLTMLMAVDMTGVVAYDITKGAMNATRFVDFLNRKLNVHASKYLLIDNASFHKTSIVMQAYKYHGLTPLFLPPYSPQFQPIEHVFAICKHEYRKSIYDLQFSLHDWLQRIEKCINSVSGLYIQRCFHAVWSRWLVYSGEK